MDLLGSDDGRGDDRHLGPQGQLDEAAAPEPLQLVAVAIQLAHALLPFGEDGAELTLAQQALGVLLAGAHRAETVEEGAEVREVKDEVLQ